MRVVSWNIAHRTEPWRTLVKDETFDVALLQEATSPPPDVRLDVYPDPSGWGPAFRTAVVGGPRCGKLNLLPVAPADKAGRGFVPESRPGTITAVEHTLGSGEVITLVSIYATWERPTAESTWIVSDASVHRLISDVSSLIGSERGHRIIVAGDLNLMHGYGDNRSRYWKGRYDTVFARMEAIGLPFVGPQYPNGLQAEPWPDELPPESRNVPTFRPASGFASRQLDYVFASRELAPRLHLRALNRPDEWGPSDHCRVEIELDE
jgi:endonuclease/exonuclease/phosphatase family metal-dependent hydrolase